MRISRYINTVGRIIRNRPRVNANNTVSIFSGKKSIGVIAKNQCIKGKKKISEAIKTKDPIVIGTAIGLFSPVPGGAFVGGGLGLVIKFLMKFLKK